MHYNNYYHKSLYTTGKSTKCGVGEGDGGDVASYNAGKCHKEGEKKSHTTFEKINGRNVSS